MARPMRIEFSGITALRIAGAYMVLSVLQYKSLMIVKRLPPYIRPLGKAIKIFSPDGRRAICLIESSFSCGRRAL